MSRLFAGDQLSESTIADMRPPVFVGGGDDTVAESLFYRHGEQIGLSGRANGSWRPSAGRQADPAVATGSGKRSPYAGGRRPGRAGETFPSVLWQR